MKKNILLIALGLLCLSACTKSEENNENKVETAQTELPEDFMQFYRTFHSDSLFQINHISFPLEGLPSYADPEELKGQNYYWSKQDWVFQKSIDFEFSDFERVLVPLNEIMVKETILHRKRALAMERKFAKFGKEWTLIYYAGLNTYTVDK